MRHPMRSLPAASPRRAGDGRRLACALHPRHGAGRSTARRVRPQSLRARSSRDAVERRLRPLRNDHDGDDRAPRERDPEGIRPRAAVADGTGLPVEPAGSPARRPARDAGHLRRGRRLSGLGDTAGRHADPVSVSRRAGTRSLAERSRDGERRREARDGCCEGAARTGVPDTAERCAVGACDRAPGPPGTCCNAAPEQHGAMSVARA